MKCKIEVKYLNGIQTVIMETSKIKAVILIGKGADLFEFIYKELEINCMYKSDVPMEIYNDLDLKKERLLNHSDRSLGGWSEALPHRGIYKSSILEQENGGIAATIPWEYEIVKDSDEYVELKAWVETPIFPLYIEKTYILSQEDPYTLKISEMVTNNGDMDMRFTWTQHALFGGEFLRGDVTIDVASDRIFKAWEHRGNPKKQLSEYEDFVYAANMQQGRFDLRNPLPKGCKEYEFMVYNNLKEGRASIINHLFGLSVTLKWDLKYLPYMRSLYQHTDDVVIIGLEPSDDMFSGLEHSIKYGTYTRLSPKETIKTDFLLSYNAT
jgi:hypothetical protein